MARKPYGYWKSLDNVEHELGKVVDRIGHIPSKEELLEYGLGSLVNAAQKYRGGLFTVKEKIGYDDQALQRKQLEGLLQEYVKEKNEE